MSIAEYFKNLCEFLNLELVIFEEAGYFEFLKFKGINIHKYCIIDNSKVYTTADLAEEPIIFLHLIRNIMQQESPMYYKGPSDPKLLEYHNDFNIACYICYFLLEHWSYINQKDIKLEISTIYLNGILIHIEYDNNFKENRRTLTDTNIPQVYKQVAVEKAKEMNLWEFMNEY